MSAVSVHDVAAHAGVSVGTVSNVMNHPEKVSPSVTARVQSAINELGFIRNDAARQLRAGRSKTIGLVVLDIGNPFFTDLARGAEDRAASAGLFVMLANSDESTERESAHIDLYEQQRVFGMLISPLGNVMSRLVVLCGRGIPAILVDRASPDVSFSSVSVDVVAGGRMAAEHLLGLGKRHIAFVGGRLEMRQAADRLKGARLAVAEHPGVQLTVIETDALSVLAGRAAGVRILESAERPDAVFAANDLVAVSVLQALIMQGSGVRVPADVALIGYDDIDFASAAVVPLSSIRQPSALMGRTAVELLLSEVENPATERRQIHFPPELVVRASSAGPL